MKEELDVAETLSQLKNLNDHGEKQVTVPAAQHASVTAVKAKLATNRDAAKNRNSAKQDSTGRHKGQNKLKRGRQGKDKPRNLVDEKERIADESTTETDPTTPTKAHYTQNDIEKARYLIRSPDFPAPQTTEMNAATVEETSQKPWCSVIMTATSMVLTREARNKVRRVLALLRLASDHLSEKVTALKINMDEDANNENVKPKISQVAIRNDIINTIKKCVTMLSTLATNNLPEVASTRVRKCLLKLPARWAEHLNGNTHQADGQSESAILALATETLVAIRNITIILSESMDRADSWMERLHKFAPDKRRRVEEPPKEPLTCNTENIEQSRHNDVTAPEIHAENGNTNEQLDIDHKM